MLIAVIPAVMVISTMRTSDEARMDMMMKTMMRMI
jgi:hypothetical protein